MPGLVFDVIKTVLDLQALDPTFESVFGDRGVRDQWFQQMLQWAFMCAVIYGHLVERRRHSAHGDSCRQELGLRPAGHWRHVQPTL